MFRLDSPADTERRYLGFARLRAAGCNNSRTWRIIVVSNLLSRIGGDAPPRLVWRRRSGWFESGLTFNFRSRSHAEQPNAGPSLLTVPTKPLRFEASPDAPLEAGKVQLQMSMKLYVGNLSFQTSSE